MSKTLAKKFLKATAITLGVATAGACSVIGVAVMTDDMSYDNTYRRSSASSPSQGDGDRLLMLAGGAFAYAAYAGLVAAATRGGGRTRTPSRPVNRNNRFTR